MKKKSITTLLTARSAYRIFGLITSSFLAITLNNAAAQDTWDGGGTDNNWSTAANWLADSAPVGAGALTFTGTTQITVNNDYAANTVFNGLTFSNTGTGAESAFTLNGNAITLGGNIIVAGYVGTASTYAPDVINLNLVLNADRDISTNGGAQNLLTINGNISQDGTTARSLSKGGSGTSGNLTLTGNNTYTGNTNINNGTIFVTKISDSGDSNIGYGNLRMGNSAQGGGLTYTGSGATTNRTIGIATGTAATHTGNGTLTTNGANGGSGLHFTAPNLIATQADATAPTRTFNITGTNTDRNTLSGVISDVSTTTKLNITKNGAGLWVLSNTASTYSGATTLASGLLEVTKLANAGSASSLGAATGTFSTFVFNGGNLRYTGSGDSTDRDMRYASPFNNGGMQINASGTGALQLTNTAALGQNTPTHNRFLQFTGTNTDENLFAGSIGTSGGTGAVNLSKGGLGKWIFTGASTYNGSTFHQGGTLEIRSAASELTYNPAGALSSSVGEATLIANKSGDGSLAINFTPSGTNNGFVRGAGASVNLVSTGGTNGVNNSMTFGAGAAGFMDKGLFFGGSEYAARHTANGYARALDYGVDANTVAVNTVTANNHVKLTSSHTPVASLTLSSVNLSGGDVNWVTANGINLTTQALLKSGGGTSTFSGAGQVRNGNSELVVRVDSASDTIQIDSGVNGSGVLTKSGSGTLILNNSTGTINDYTGATHVNAGVLSISSNQNLGSAAGTSNALALLHLKGGTLRATATFGLNAVNQRNVVLTNQSTIEVTDANTLTIGGVISHNTASSTTVLNGFNKSGTGTLVLSGANTYNGATNVDQGVLALGASNTLPDETSLSIGNATLALSDFEDKVGTVDPTAAATITLGTSGKIEFADSSNVNWSGGSINFTGTFVSGQSIRFGNSSSALTPSQLAQITINGIPGSYTLSTSGHLTSATADPYTTWAGSATFHGDDNNDGIANGLAWLLGAASPTVSASALLPSVSQNSGNLTMNFSMLPASVRDGAKLFIEYSSDLGLSDPWTSVEIPDATGGSVPATFTVSGTNPLNIQSVVSSVEAASGKLFARLRAQR